MVYKKSIYIFALLLVLLVACTPKHADLIVAAFDDYQIKMDEFEKAYAKNVGGFENAVDDSIENFKNFIDLYVNFKMKLRDAQIRGFDSDKELIDELESYKKKVGSSYIFERNIINPGLEKLYNDRKDEIRVSHIMIRPDSISLSEAKELSENLLNRIKNGESFEKLAMEYSADQYSKIDGGDIYWITAGQVIPEFENAAYETHAGQVYPEPVKTNYGYHLIKVTDRQPRRSKIQARHILISFNGSDSSEAFQKITDIKNRIHNGEDFAELAKQFSDDKGSGEKGGDLGFFSRRMMVKPFDEAVFNLKIGELSDIVKTRYGYHLIEVTAEEKYPSFDDEKETLRDIYKKTRYDNDYNSFIDNLKSKYNYTANADLINDITNYKDTIIVNDGYLESQFRNEYKDKTVINIAKNQFAVDSVFTYALNESKFKNKVINRNNTFSDAVSLYGAMKLLEEAAFDLDKENEEFASLMKDYKNGIYIFKLQEEEVWNKINVDSNEVKKYFETNKSNFNWPDRVEFSEILFKQDSTANRIFNALKTGSDFDSLAKKYTSRLGFKIKKGYHGLQEVSEDELAQLAFSLQNEGDISDPIKTKDGLSIIKLIKKDPARIKTFEEAKAEIASIIQEKESKRLEEDYINRLKSIYKPEYLYESLERAFNKEY